MGVREFEGDNPEMLAAHIRANIEHEFGFTLAREQNWDVHRESFCRKLWEMVDQELAQEWRLAECP